MIITGHKRLFFALASGTLNILIFPKADVTLLSWIVLVPLLVAIYREERNSRSFFYGCLCGIVFFFGSCHWIINVLENYGGLGGLGSVLSFLLLVIYLSLFYAGFALLFSGFARHFPDGCFFLAPAIWVSCEYLRGQLLTGFPWCLLGYALVDFTSLARIATVTGVYGLSFLLVLINALTASALIDRSRGSVARLIITLLLLGGISGFSSLWHSGIQQPTHRAYIVQPNLSPEQNWDLESKSTVLNSLSQLSLAAVSKDKELPSGIVRVTIWPETPAPFYFNRDPVFRLRMTMLARDSASHLLFGFVDFKRDPETGAEDPYNSVALLSPEGNLISQYDKVHLVPFGEYVPYPRVFFFVDKISTEAGSFKPGSRLVVSPLDDEHRISSFVCYEAIFPELVRRSVDMGAGALFNLTNDGWFGDSAAPYQHLNMARFRAIENQRYLLRAANNGISAVINPDGVVLKRTRLNERTLLEGDFEFKTTKTIYTRFGDWFAWLCLLTVVFAGGYLNWRTRSSVSIG